MSVAISSGHSAFLSGAVGILHERNENVRVSDRVAAILRARNVQVAVFHDNTSRTVSANIGAIVAWHRRQTRRMDVSIHFNAFRRTDSAMGTECLHRNQPALATRVSAAMARGGGFRDRGAKHRTNLGFLNQLTTHPTILLEVCFVDSSHDARLYRENFERVCQEIASSIGGVSVGPSPPPAPGARPVIRQGARGDAVREAQGLLNQRNPTTLPRLTVDGIFGPRTDARTREFQRNVSITADGIIGPITWGRLTS
jgi:N-acetylmuramoyl-L-alanine amidase